MKFPAKPISIIIFFSAVLAVIFSLEIKSAPTDLFRETFSKGVSKFLALAEEIAPDESYFFPTYPQRLMYLVAELSQSGKELVSLNETLETSIGKCGCQFAKSQCESGGTSCNPGPLKTFGEPCQNREEIRKGQSEISEKNDQISHLKNLLKTEMENGLERELKTLRPEVATELKNNLETIIKESEDILLPAEQNQGLPETCLAENCSASCSQGSIFSLNACLLIGTGEQRQLELKFKAGVALDNLKLGKIGINNVNLGLPEEIQLPKLEDLSITIPSQEVVITFPQTTVAELQSKNLLDLSSQSVSLNPQLSLPSPPGINLSCPNLPNYQSYQCSSQGTQSKYYIDAEWYFQNFSWLSEKCQELPGMSGTYWLEEKAKDCFDPENVHLTIIKECDAFWLTYNPEFPTTIPPICESLGKPCLGRERAKERECQNLLNQNPGCLLEILCQTNKLIYCSVAGQCGGPEQFYDGYITKENVETIIKTLEGGCDQLKADERREMPESCKFLPLFTGKFEKPEPFEYSGGAQDCPSQEIANFPSSMLSCPASPPTLPKLSLPKIIIPDIIMPSLDIPPFLQIKLPSFYFEDLVLPDINLCDLNACANIFPSLGFNFPYLNLPQMKPSLRLPDLDVLFYGIRIKVPMPEIKTDINFPPIVFGMPTLSEFNLGKLLTPELSIPKIQLPKPKITFAFSGIDLSAIFDLISTFIMNALGIPDLKLCINFSISAAPLRIIFPDYYFTWPAFPKIPEIPFCKDIQDFCQNVKTSLKTVTDEIGEIEGVLNQVFSEEVQEKLNQLAQLVNGELAAQIDGILEGYSQMIQAEVQKALGLATIESGIIKIPAVVLWLPEEKITIPLDDMSGLPEKIPIPWPEELKKINLPIPLNYDLPEIPLSELSYQKEVKIKGPGFQLTTASISLDNLGNLGSCIPKPPTGGNPCPQGEFQTNLGNIRNIQQEINETSNKIIDILE